MKRNIKFYLIVTLLVLVEVASVFLMCKSLSDKLTLEDVKLKEIDNKDTFAIMLGDKDGVYTESTSNTWPSNKSYTYNSERSGCIDKDGNKIENALTFNSETNIATVSVSQTAYCYLYFDIDSMSPQAFTFYLGGSSNPTYTTSTSTTAYLSWTDTDITEVCITNTQGSDNCTWQSVSGTSTTISHTLTSSDATKTVYAYLKDEAGNISSEVTDTIILDTTKPVINSVTKTSDEQESISISVSASDSNNIKTYYYSINNGSYVSSSSNTYTFSSLTSGTSYTISVYVVDNAGNQSVTNTQTFSTKDKGAGEVILEDAPTGLNTTAYNGMYRFVGSSVNNYVSIGGVSYRIIGITSAANSTLGLEAGQLKVIKTDSIGTYNWHTSALVNATWNTGGTDAAMYTYLNGTVLSNTSYIPSGWSDKIDSVKWYVGDVQTYTNASTIIGLEDDTVTNSTSKVGLMYLSDYYYSAVSGGTTNCVSTACTTSWIYNSSLSQWTMTRYGQYSDGSYYAWIVRPNGRDGYYVLTYTIAVRPVFYLTSDVAFKSGTGTSTDPFVLE